MEADDADAPLTLCSLPPELVSLVLVACETVATLSRAACCCKHWRQLVPWAATERLRYMNGEEPPPPSPRCPLRALDTHARLARAVGPRPQRRWEDDWPTARIEQAVLMASRTDDDGVALEAMMQWKMQVGQERLDELFCRPHGPLSVDREARTAFSRSIEWKVRNGYSEADAVACTLLSSKCSSALALAIIHWRRDITASVWALCDVLWKQPVPCAPLEGGGGADLPPCYASLRGEFGLFYDDEPAWRRLLSDPPPALGWRSRTYGFALAMRANDNCFPDGAGYRAPVNRSDGGGLGAQVRVRYDLRDSDIVRFVNAQTDHLGTRRSLVLVDDDTYRLPPFSLVTLVGIHEPGEWCAHRGVPVAKRCFDVTVEY